MNKIFLFSFFSILGTPVYPLGFYPLGLLKSLLFTKKKLKSYNNFEIALQKLELVNNELEEKINSKPTQKDNLALRLLNIIECKKIIQCETNNFNGRLTVLIKKLTSLKEKWEEYLNGQPVSIEDLNIMISEVKACKNIISREMYTLCPFPIGIS
jgi:hypothetical protein